MNRAGAAGGGTQSRDVVSLERLVPAPPERVFDLLAHPSRHPDIDGSGTVRQAREGGGGRLCLGSRFAMSMRAGLAYSMVNEVVEFEEGRRIAWQARPAGRMGGLVGGRIWRYQLAPADGATRVRESWDISQDRQRWLLGRGPVRRQVARAIEQTLERIEALVADSPERSSAGIVPVEGARPELGEPGPTAAKGVSGAAPGGRVGGAGPGHPDGNPG